MTHIHLEDNTNLIGDHKLFVEKKYSMSSAMACGYVFRGRLDLSKLKQRKFKPEYYPNNVETSERLGKDGLIQMHEKYLFDEPIVKPIQFNGVTYYRPVDCMTGIFNIHIHPDVVMFAHIDGVTRDYETILLVDTWTGRQYEDKNKFISNLSMSIWGAKKCILHLAHTNRIIEYTLDTEYVQGMLKGISKYLDTHLH